jgi:hypothetical protein
MAQPTMEAASAQALIAPPPQFRACTRTRPSRHTQLLIDFREWVLCCIWCWVFVRLLGVLQLFIWAELFIPEFQFLPVRRASRFNAIRPDRRTRELFAYL